MLDKTDDIAVTADNWLARFEDALAKSDDRGLKTLFHPDSHWRDVLALSWNIQTVNGATSGTSDQGDRGRAVAARGEACCGQRMNPSSVIPGCAESRPRCAIAHRGIHTHDRGYGFRACAKWRIPE